MTTFAWSECLQPAPLPALCEKLFSGDTDVVVYGAGTAGQDLVRVLRQRGVGVTAILDAKSSRREVGGLCVVHPDAPEFTPARRASTIVAMGVFNAFVDPVALQDQLAQWGWQQVIDFVDLHAAMPDELGTRYWLGPRAALSTRQNEIAKVDELWADDLSRSLYRNVWRFRATGDHRRLPRPDPATQYFAPDVPSWEQPLRMVDCGACDGDTLAQVERLGLPVAALALFEPDPANFAHLAERSRTWNGRGVPILAWPCGVHRQTQLLRFRADQGAASNFDAQGETVLPCVALDDALTGFRPNLIKMDIEGAEEDALFGARHQIQENRPGLAICVYHRPDDLWSLPALLASWNLGYSFYLRAHQFSGFDLVLYALPGSR